MEITINNKIFIGKYDENGKLIIQLSEPDDISFFQIWSHKSSNGTVLKKDVVQDFKFINGLEQGVLCQCFPMINKNLDSVELVYDYKSGGLVFDCGK